MAAPIDEDDPIPAAAYVRPLPGDERLSAARQREALEAFARAWSMRIDRWFEEACAEGAEAPRPALDALLQAAAGRGRDFDFVLVLDAARFAAAHDPEGAAVHAALAEAGAQPLYAAEPLRNDGRAVTRRLKAAWRGQQARSRGALLRAAKRRGAVAGFRMGGLTPYGYRRRELGRRGEGRLLERGQCRAEGTRSLLVPGPAAEVETVRRIFRLYAESGWSAERIAKRLNAEGAPPGEGVRAWRPNRIRLMLRNEVYAGTHAYRSGGRWGYGGEVVRRHDACEPLVDRPLWEAAQARRDARTRRPGEAEVLAGLRRVLKLHGVLTWALIEAEPGMPGRTALKARFGSLEAAAARIGYALPPAEERRRMMEQVGG